MYTEEQLTCLFQRNCSALEIYLQLSDTFLNADDTTFDHSPPLNSGFFPDFESEIMDLAEMQMQPVPISPNSALRLELRSKCIFKDCNLKNVALEDCLIVNATITDSSLDRCVLYNSHINSSLVMESKLVKCLRSKCEVSPTPTFNSIPAEIRNLIFSNAIEWNGKTPNVVAAVRGDPVLYAEALGVLHRQSTFKLHAANRLSRSVMSPKAYQSVRKLEIG